MSPKAAPGREDRHRVVLVVEDEILVRSVTAEFLRIAGYNVVEAANAAEAVAVFTAGTVIDLVFSDINFMAGPNSMDGVGLARWVSQHHPGVHVILTSGNTQAARAADVAATFLSKPYRAREAILRISALLEDLGAPQPDL
jgi:CheY-like chemotaxis protein